MPSHPSQRPQAGPASDPNGPVVLRATLLVVAVVAAIFGLVLLVGAFVPRVYGEVRGSVDAELVLPDDTELPRLKERSYVYGSDGTLLATLHDEEERVLVDFGTLPDHVWQAIVTAEDRRFFEHEGYDVEGIGRALVANVRAGGIEQGGSTITQQIAKLNFLDDSVTFERKFTELLYSMALEDRFDKEYLLGRYLNEVYFGAGAYGVQAAAEEYWGIEAGELEPQQSALLAGIVRAPGLYDPRRDPDGAIARRNAILAGMADEGYLEPDDVERLVEFPLDVDPPPSEEVLEPYVVEAVKREFLSNPAFGETRDERRELLFGGGLHLYTTIDIELQQLAREVVADHFPSDAPTAAIAAVEPDTGAIVALQSGQDFDSLQYDLALQGRRQPGSAMKPFVMVQALREGITPGLRIDSRSPLTIELPIEDWTVSNYGGSSYGKIDMREATKSSVNTYYAQLARMVGVQDTMDLTYELGIDRAAYGGYAGLAAVSIGGLGRGITPLEMASAYGVLANGGVRADPFFLGRVERDGKPIWAHESLRDRVVDESVAATAIDILQEVVRSGTGRAAQIPGWDVAGKTGTTNDNYDAWFVGMTPVMATAVWVGHPTGNVVMPGATGGGLAAPVWQDFMEQALEGYERTPFPEAELIEPEDEDDEFEMVGVDVDGDGDFDYFRRVEIDDDTDEDDD